MSDRLTGKLSKGLQALTLQFSEEQLANLVAYLKLLQKWNSAYNLVADSDDDVILTRHILDSLSISRFVKGKTVLDVGTGAGLPGVPLAILHPDTHFTLLDSNGKKTRFLFQVKLDLSLSNITVENCRVEHYQSNQQIDIVTCRAFSSLPDITARIAQYMGHGSLLLAMKGRYPEQEIAADLSGFKIVSIEKLEVPGEGADRHLVVLERNVT